MSTTSATGTLGVLLIEDDDDDALIVEDLLADVGAEFRLLRARTLKEGIAMLPGDINCALLDLRLPDTVGVDGVRRLREAAPWLAVIVLTGLDDERAGQDAVDAGAQDYLIKGKVAGGLLARSIRYAVGRRHAEDVLQQLRVAEVRADENARLERGLVPRPIVNDPALWIASRYLPGRQRALLGGDFFDVVQTDDACLRVVIGDVSGRGPDEAALGAGLRIAWRALTLARAPEEGVISTLETMIENERRDAGAFATLCTLEIGPSDRTLHVRRAGHPAPMILDGSGVVSLPLTNGGPPIGMFAGSQWPRTRYSLSDDWTVMLYTDGLIEGRDGKDGHLGERGLRELVAADIAEHPEWRSAPRDLLMRVIERATELNGQDLDDDVAALLLGCD